MLPSKARVQHLVDRLTAAGFTPETTDHDGYTCIRMPVPNPVPAERWQELVSVLDTADSFGLVDSRGTGCTVWAAVTTAAPGAPSADPGRGPQL